MWALYLVQSLDQNACNVNLYDNVTQEILSTDKPFSVRIFFDKNELKLWGFFFFWMSFFFFFHFTAIPTLNRL